MFWLCRWHSTTQRLTQCQDAWGYDFSVLSKIFKAVNEWMDTSHKHLLTQSLPRIVNRFLEFCETIRAKLKEIYPGLELPPDSLST